MNSTNELRWAAELAKSKNGSVQKKKIPLERQQKNADEEILYLKNQLKKSRPEDVPGILNKLFSARARQTALQVAKLKITYGSIGSSMAKEIIAKHIKDCEKLLKIFSIR